MRYSTGAIVLHWLIAVLIVINLGLAWAADDQPREVARQLIGNHKAIGITILLLSVVRIFWRLAYRRPPFAPEIKAWEAALARLVHGFLYFLMIGVPLAGWLMTSARSGGAPIPVFGLFEYPGLPLAKDRAAGETLETVHVVLAYLTIGLVGLHMLGALKHQFVDRVNELGRMGLGKAPAA